MFLLFNWRWLFHIQSVKRRNTHNNNTFYLKSAFQNTQGHYTIVNKVINRRDHNTDETIQEKTSGKKCKEQI